MGIMVHGVAGRKYPRKASFLFAIVGVLASTSFAHAIDPRSHAQATEVQTDVQQLASQVNELRIQVTRMQTQIAKTDGELAVLQEQKIQAQQAQAQQALPATEEPHTRSD